MFAELCQNKTTYIFVVPSHYKRDVMLWTYIIGAKAKRHDATLVGFCRSQ